jgi:hypothetical protein
VDINPKLPYAERTSLLLRRPLAARAAVHPPFLISFSCRVEMSFLDHPKGSKMPPG